MKSRTELNQELRQRILSLSGVTERQNAGIHEDAFFVGRTMFMHIHGQGRCDIRLAKVDQSRVLAEGKAHPHRWAPEAGYVTSIVDEEQDLEPAMELIRKSHDYFAERSPELGTQASEEPAENAEKAALRLFVIGATGRTGREIVEQALAHGHQVTAFVRSPEHLGLDHERLTTLKGNPVDEDQLAGALRGHDAVLTTLGPRKVFKRTSLLEDSALALTRAMSRAGVARLLVLSAAAHFPGLPNRVASFVMRDQMRDSLAMEKIVRASGLDWTIARPPRLTEGESSTYRSQEGAPPRKGFSIARKAVAAFMLDAIEQRKHSHKIVGLAK